ncbi:Microtubule-associated proteins 1A/1B light chain 3C, variant 2 [Dermatophagoides farinae]|uniref:Microtubule-associated proteins 1A/1B light chain 3C, variant 2 n=1 Tax=Dermatophagoides farinae TaxID=6954 RepID=A0A922IHB0_DERFA|nr:Microtubule-associated proteins 1A/1B light chain 3C, variant 2 [Dermatophagoides farinae]
MIVLLVRLVWMGHKLVPIFFPLQLEAFARFETEFGTKETREEVVDPFVVCLSLFMIVVLGLGNIDIKLEPFSERFMRFRARLSSSSESLSCRFVTKSSSKALICIREFDVMKFVGFVRLLKVNEESDDDNDGRE